MEDDNKLSYFFLGLGLGVAVGVLFAACIYGLVRHPGAATINNVCFAAFHISVLMTGCWAALQKPPAPAPGSLEAVQVPA